jgi:DNA-binding NarL/FixJ family response regulator
MNILLIDDHTMVRQALKFYLQELDPSVTVTAAGTLTEAQELSPDPSNFDLIVLDFRGPGIDAIAGFSAVAERFPGVPFVILSESISRAEALLAIEAGAAGVIPKQYSAEVMINALRLILSGEKYLPFKFFQGGEKARLPFAESREDDPHGLTVRQREVINLLTQGLPNKEIAAALGVKEVTVKLHLSRIFKKIGATNRTEAVRIAMGCRPEDLRQPVNAG